MEEELLLKNQCVAVCTATKSSSLSIVCGTEPEIKGEFKRLSPTQKSPSWSYLLTGLGVCTTVFIFITLSFV